MDKIDTTIDTMQGDITYIKTRIDNGFSTSIQSTENKVNYIDNQNEVQHKSIRDDIKDLNKKIDKIFWMFGTGAVAVIIKEVVRGVV